jgi:glycosyltransferase involved in cell wall biosynthesis
MLIQGSGRVDSDMLVKTLIIVPAYNAGRTISELLGRLTGYVDRSDILVIDDGSADNTGELAREEGVTVLTHDVNRGKGAALKTGFRHAIERGYDAVVTLDADLQHDPDLVPDLLQWASTGKYDIIIGTRRRSGQMPVARAFANFASSIAISLFSGTLIRDSQSGYRWIGTDVLRRIPLRGDRYDLESEILLRVGLMGGSIGEVRVPTIYRDSVSSINPVTDSARAIRILWSRLFW